MREIAAELNIGLDSISFLDDNPVERQQVRDATPEVMVLELPDDPMHHARAVRDFPAFERLALGEEDAQRNGCALGMSGLDRPLPTLRVMAGASLRSCSIFALRPRDTLLQNATAASIVRLILPDQPNAAEIARTFAGELIPQVQLCSRR